MKTIGFIGAGNMARPIIRNTAEKGVFEEGPFETMEAFNKAVAI